METQVISDLSSDHFPVVLYLRETPSIQGTGTRLSNGWTTIWYADAVSSQLDLSIKIRTPTDLDSAVKTFTELLIAAARTATPSPTLQHTRKPCCSSSAVKEAIQTRRKLHHRWQISRDPEVKREFN